jgi:phosphocarrier protein FPr
MAAADEAQRMPSERVGLVLVSHSADVAEGAATLARAMAAEVRIGAAGGLTPPAEGLGTDAARIAAAIDEVWSPAGVLVLMDLGSALLSAELARDMVAEERRGSVLLSGAALVEGAVAAAVAAQIGQPLKEVAQAAQEGLAGKVAQLAPAEAPADTPAGVPPAGLGGWEEILVPVSLPMGLHARPIAKLISVLAQFDAEVELANATTNQGPASGRSLNAIAQLQVARGQELRVRARGPQAAELLEAVGRLAGDGFGEPPAGPAPVPLAPAIPLGPTAMSSFVQGIPAAPGLAVGPVVHLAQAPLDIPDRAPSSPEEERRALRSALDATREDLVKLREVTSRRAGEYQASILDAQMLFLEDPELLERAEADIDRGSGAAEAWSRSVARARSGWDQIKDENLRARALDLDGVARRVLGHVLGVGPAAPTGVGILVVEELTPTDAAGLDRQTVVAIAVAGGGPTSHSAILARALGIPATVGLGPTVMAIPEGTTVILDGDSGRLIPNPHESELAEASKRRGQRHAAQAAIAEAVRTADGLPIEVAANIGSVADARAAVAAGADGVGLLRTEFLFQDAPAMPSSQEQLDVYRDICAILSGRPLTIRTLDAGADKPLAYIPRPIEANPALGVRGLRLGLRSPDLLLGQIRSIVQVAASNRVRLMFPMVSTLAEIVEARRLVSQVIQDLPGPEWRGLLEVGIMVETPAAALTAARLAPEIDFFSIGTNDLSQYTLAADRTNPEVAGLADPLHPAVLRLIGETADAGRSQGKWVGVCGELAGDALAAPLLIGLGVTELSMNPSLVPLVKAAVKRVDSTRARRLADRALGLTSAEEVRDLLAAGG